MTLITVYSSDGTGGLSAWDRTLNLSGLFPVLVSFGGRMLIFGDNGITLNEDRWNYSKSYYASHILQKSANGITSNCVSSILENSWENCLSHASQSPFHNWNQFYTLEHTSFWEAGLLIDLLFFSSFLARFSPKIFIFFEAVGNRSGFMISFSEYLLLVYKRHYWVSFVSCTLLRLLFLSEFLDLLCINHIICKQVYFDFFFSYLSSFNFLPLFYSCNYFFDYHVDKEWGQCTALSHFLF